MLYINADRKPFCSFSYESTTSYTTGMYAFAPQLVATMRAEQAKKKEEEKMFDLDAEAIPLRTSTPKKGGIPSLGNPPNAPRKRPPPTYQWGQESVWGYPWRRLDFDQEEEEERAFLERQECLKMVRIVRRMKIRREWRSVIPQDIDGVLFEDTIFKYHKMFFGANVHPRNTDELFYLKAMEEAISNRLANFYL
jgi:hypothetical protein